jgi:uncharacterized membrane protein
LSRGDPRISDIGDTEVTLRVAYQVPSGLLALVASALGAAILRRNVRRSLSALRDLVEAKGT